MSSSHRAEAERLAKEYVAGDEEVRRRIAETCEAHGILSALVVAELSNAIRSDFVARMVKAAEPITP